jgi:Secretory lipase
MGFPGTMWKIILACVLLCWSLPQAQALEDDIRPVVQLDTNSSKYLPLPTDDSFFSPLDGWEKTAPGTLLKLRKHAYPTISIGNCSDTFQIQYRTTDTHGNASYAISTIFIPASHANCSETNPDACSHGIITYQVPYDSSCVDAGPSYLLQFTEPYGEMRNALSRGWFLNVPDYEGPLASYCAGVQAAHASLDSIRAVKQVLGDFGFRMDKARHALWGYSGGAFATIFTAELAATYAPELVIHGAVAGGTAPNLTTVDKLMNKQDTAGLVVASILGITTQHPTARMFMLQQLMADGPYNASYWMSANYMSGVQVLTAFAYQDVANFFRNGSKAVWGTEIQSAFDLDAAMGYHGIPNMPVFIYKAVQDEMSPVKETDDLVAGYCAGGANVLYHRNTAGGHNQELWSGRPRALLYLEAVLDGKKTLEIPATGCLTVNVSVPVNLTEIAQLYSVPDKWRRRDISTPLTPLTPFTI